MYFIFFISFKLKEYKYFMKLFDNYYNNIRVIIRITLKGILLISLIFLVNKGFVWIRMLCFKNKIKYSHTNIGSEREILLLKNI